MYTDAFVFINDYSALLHNTPKGSIAEEGLLIAESQSGICKVISYSPLHNVTLAQMEEAAIEKVVHVWQQEFIEISKNKKFVTIQRQNYRFSMSYLDLRFIFSAIWSL